MANVTVIPATIQRHSRLPVSSAKKRRVAGYARVSTDSAEQLTSYEAQVDYYTRYIRSNTDWEFAGVYTDEGISALNTRHREGFNRMVEDALAGKIDLIVTKSVSRFARNTVDSLSTIRKLKEYGVEVYFEKESIWSFDGKGELLLTIMSSLAQEESRSISEIVCGDCGGYYGGKVWHSTDKYRRVIWQCNGKYRWKERCSTPHLNEEEIKKHFLSATATLLSDRSALLEDCTLMRDTLADTSAIDKECKKLKEEMDTVSALTENLIAENANAAISLTDYDRKYDAYTERYNKAKERHDKLQRKKVTLGFEVDILECFLFEIEALPGLPVEFSDRLWNALIDHATVYHDDRIVFSFKNGAEITEEL